jgi:hypothetical protein
MTIMIYAESSAFRKDVSTVYGINVRTESGLCQRRVSSPVLPVVVRRGGLLPTTKPLGLLLKSKNIVLSAKGFQGIKIAPVVLCFCLFVT